MNGAFISVEGVDGAGKTTQLQNIAAFLDARGIAYVRTREPGGTALGEKARAWILDGSVALCAHAELLLLFAARAQNLQENIAPALAEGKWVLCDRFTESSYAYQGGGRGIDENMIAALEKYVQGDIRPDVIFVLDVPVETGMQRIRARGDGRDRFDEQTDAFRHAVRRVFTERAAKNARMHLIDASGGTGEVRMQIETRLQNFLRARAQTCA